MSYVHVMLYIKKHQNMIDLYMIPLPWKKLHSFIKIFVNF